jgi:predicted RNA binding protein YcfA (HicA-like mRNA interferase family)
MPAIRPLPYQKLARIFEAAGCVYSHTRGDHLVYHCPGALRPVVIPKYREVVIGLTRERYLQLEAQV